jgi:uncharacterized protein
MTNLKFSLILLCFHIFGGCKISTYDRVKNYVDTLEIIDTHEHQQSPVDSTEFYFFNTSYFPSDLHNAGAPSLQVPHIKSLNTDSLWQKAGRYYNYARATSYHAQLMYNLKLLYGYNKPYLLKEDMQQLYDTVLNNQYKHYTGWFDTIFKRAHFKLMLQDQHWNRFNTKIDTNYFRLVCNIHQCVSFITEAAETKTVVNKDLLSLLGTQELKFTGLQDYVTVIDSVLNKFKRDGAVCIKNTLAYYRSLDFEPVDVREAAAIFDRAGKLTAAETKKLEDYIFHHIIQRSIDLDLPIQMHTGYLAGLGGRIDHGHPMQLINLFVLYPKAKFILFHAGYPWTGDCIALGKQFSNVYMDLVWLPQISRTAAIRTLHEMLDAVPYNKICWGGDVVRIDDAVGSLELAKDVVATVLAERIEKGWMDEALAFDIARHIFHDNAIALFQLK